MAKRELKNCIICSETYLSWRKTQIYCSKSCKAKEENFKHGHSQRDNRSPEYSVWAGVMSRIRNPDKYHAKYYSHIDIDNRWYDFRNFLKDMGKRPSLKHSINRIDNNKGYYKNNCEWTTHKKQMNNTSHNTLITFKNATMTQSQWADKIGIHQNILCKRLKRGWSIEKTLTTPKLR